MSEQRKIWDLLLELDFFPFFSHAFSVEDLGLFQDEVEKFFCRICIFFSGFYLKPQVFQVWTCFSRFSMCGGNPVGCVSPPPYPSHTGLALTASKQVETNGDSETEFSTNTRKCVCHLEWNFTAVKLTILSTNLNLISPGFNKVGIETLNGTRYAADTIVYAIGFNPAQSWHSVATYGREDGPGVRKGVPLHKQWGDEPNAYLGLAYPGYPNLFYLLGPGTSLGHHSVLFMIECQITYVLDAINKMVRRNITSIDVKEEVNDEYQKWAQACMKGKAFNSNTCSSWYHNSKGVNYTLYPNSCTQYWWQTRRADLSKYRCMYAR